MFWNLFEEKNLQGCSVTSRILLVSGGYNQPLSSVFNTNMIASDLCWAQAASTIVHILEESNRNLVQLKQIIDKYHYFLIKVDPRKREDILLQGTPWICI